VDKLKVAVVGGGVAGAAAYRALKGLTNLCVDWFGDPNPSVPPVVVLWSNGLAALDALGLGGSIQPWSSPLERLDIRGEAGDLLWALPAGSLGRKVAGFKASNEEPGDLAAARVPRVVSGPCLLEVLTSDPKERKVGKVTAGKGGKVEVGGEPYDLVIGADGAESEVRRVVAEAKGRGAWPTDLDAAGVVAVFGEVEGLVDTDLIADGVGFATQGNGVRFGVVERPPEPGKRLKGYYWYAFVRRDALPDRDLSERGLSPANPEAVWRLTRGLHAPVPELVRRGLGGACARELFTRAPKGGWVETVGTTAIALVGDAAHPMLPDLGQGCAMAMEDALVLRACLEPVTTRADVGRALSAWYEKRRERVELVWRLSALACGLGSARSPSTVREAVLRGPFAATSLAVFRSLLEERVVD
jgi:2-polyprenyl-6-methoxyphenol hydroxylase-like FAD-dependent oxidoreductase